jgi:glutamate racemase
LFAQACPRFVEFVEAGITTGPEVLAVAEEYLAPLKAAQIDTLVLGCTHYPHISAAIQYVMGRDVTLVSSAEATAYDVYSTLVAHNLLRDSTAPAVHTFEATGPDKAGFTRLASRFMGPNIVRVETFETGAISVPTLPGGPPSN